MRLVSEFIYYASSFQKTSQILNVASLCLPSLFLTLKAAWSLSESSQMVCGSGPDFLCVCLGLNKRVESHQVRITLYETDKRKRYKEIFERSLVSLLTSLCIPYEKTKKESLFGKECVWASVGMRACVNCYNIVVCTQLQCGCLAFTFVT